MRPEWQDFKKEFYKNNGLVHHYDTNLNRYVINFKITGFDKDPLISLIIDANKKETVNQDEYYGLNDSDKDYNKYAWSLLNDEIFEKSYKKMQRNVKTV
jgi:hypothetical protein